MFDISFVKLIVISVVALIVIGPRRLPSVARTIGKLLGNAQLYSARIKAEFTREIAAQEWREMQEKMQQSYHSLTKKLETQNNWQDDLESNTLNVNQLSEKKTKQSIPKRIAVKRFV